MDDLLCTRAVAEQQPRQTAQSPVVLVEEPREALVTLARRPGAICHEELEAAASEVPRSPRPPRPTHGCRCGRLRGQYRKDRKGFERHASIDNWAASEVASAASVTRLVPPKTLRPVPRPAPPPKETPTVIQTLELLVRLHESAQISMQISVETSVQTSVQISQIRHVPHLPRIRPCPTTWLD